MEKELKKDTEYLYVNYELIKKYSNKIKLVVDSEVIYEGEISNNLAFELNKFEIGKFVRLYIETYGYYFFVDKEIIAY